jgi:hypothetical protein
VKSLRKLELIQGNGTDKTLDPSRKTEELLRKLQLLKGRVSQLKEQCEEIQSYHMEEKGLYRCDECGRSIERGQEVEAKNFCDRSQYYHKKCFRKLWMQ